MAVVRIRQEHTIRREVSLAGFGYWSGRDVTMTFQPLPAGNGVVFERSDLPNKPRIPAHIEYRSEGQRRTNLAWGPASVDMVEHVLAALAGLQIDNCLVTCDQPEMPGFDGSSAPFISVLAKAGRIPQATPRRQLVVTHSFRLEEGDAWIEVAPSQQARREMMYVLNYRESPAIGQQIYLADLDRVNFIDEIAPARTFLTTAEAQMFRDQGRGERVIFSDLLVFDDSGPIDNILRFENECARHKLLDMIGDFSLMGCDLIGKVTAYRSGHRLNGAMVSELLQRFSMNASHLRAA